MDKDEHWFLNGKKVIKQQMLSKSSQQIINGVSITLEASFGCLQNAIRKNCVFVNDDTLMFISGKHIVLYDIIRKRQTYIMKSAEDEVVNALNYYVTTSQKLLIALAFKSSNKVLPTVKVYNRNKKRFYQLVHSHLLPNSNVFEIQFVNQGKVKQIIIQNVITLSQSEEGYGLSLFSIAKEVSLSYTVIKQQITLLEPLNQLDFLILGPNYFQLYKYQLDINGIEQQSDYYNQSHYEQDEHLIDCAYNEENRQIIVATTHNNLLLFNKDQLIYKYTILCSTIHTRSNVKKDEADLHDFPFRISSITKTHKGFIVALSGKPALQVFELSHSNFTLMGSYTIQGNQIYGIHQIHLASDEMYAALTVIQMTRNKGENITTEQALEHGKLELFTFNLAIVEALRSVLKDPFEPLFEKGVHKGTIFSIATTPMRSIIASVCEDKTVKFWDYSNDFKELFSHQFHEESPLCVAIHPLSYQCAIGFKDGMKIYFILDAEIKRVHEVSIKQCQAIAYSDGGNFLAAAHQIQNTYQIILYDPLTYYPVKTIKEFANHQTTIKEIQFVDRDMFLISQCAYGVLYVQNIYTRERFVEHAQKQNKYHVLHYDYYYDLVIGVCDQRIKVFNDKGSNLALELDTSPTQFSSICISQRYNAIFFGTTQGSIRIYSYPFYHFNPKTMEYIEIPVHQQSVTQIKISPDNAYLISTSVDGSIFFSKIKQYINGHEVSQLELISQGEIEAKVANTFAFNNLYLISETNQIQKSDAIKELEYTLQNFKSEIEDRKEEKLNSHDGYINQFQKKHQANIHSIREELSQTIQQSDTNITKLKLDTIQLRKNSKQTICDLEEEHNQKLLSLYKIRDNLSELLVQQEQTQNKQRKQIEQEYQSSIQQVDDEYIQKYNDLYERFDSAMKNMKQDQRKFKEALQQGEKDYETFYQESQQKLLNELQQLNDKTEITRSSISKNTKETKRLEHRKEFLGSLIKDTREQVANLERELEIYRDKHRGMLVDLREKEQLINQREQQIKDFRLKNVHLQNFQKVYDYRVSTLKDEKEPLTEHLKNMEKHVKNLYNELIEESGLKQQRIEDKQNLKTNVRMLQIQLQSAKQVLALSIRKMDLFRFSITTLLKKDCSSWKEGLEQLYYQLQSENSKAIKIKNQVFQETLKDMQKDPIQQQIDQSQHNAIFRELSSQKQFLQKKLQDVETAVKYQLDERQEAYYTIQFTNDKLIKQCTALRDEKQRLKEFIDKQNKAYREIKRELTSQGVQIPTDDEGNKFTITSSTAFTKMSRTKFFRSS